MLLHLLDVPGILESLVRLLGFLVLQVLYGLPEILDHMQLGLVVLDQDLEVLQGGDDLLHERGHLLGPVLINEMLELLMIIGIN